MERLKEEEGRTLQQKELEIKESSEALKQQMLHKIRQKKAELFSLKKDNFGEEIEVVLQQNYHYTNQLDYQTKHYEYLIIQNEKLKIQLETIVNDYRVHKNIQNELVNRIFLSSQIIDELGKKVEFLESRKAELQGKIEAERERAFQRIGQPRASIDQSVNVELVKKSEKEEELRSEMKGLIAENNVSKQKLFGFCNTAMLLKAAVSRVREEAFKDAKKQELPVKKQANTGM